MSDGIIIRRAEMKDIPEIAAMEKEYFTNPWDEKGFMDALFYYPGTFFVAELCGRVVGFVCAGIEDGGSTIYGHIMNIAVATEFRGKGIGGRLIQRVEYECAVIGAEALQLEVRVSNVTAQRIYQTMGFSQVFVIGGYYPDGEDAIIMLKSFDYCE